MIYCVWTAGVFFKVLTNVVYSTWSTQRNTKHVVLFEMVLYLTGAYGIFVEMNFLNKALLSYPILSLSCTFSF